MHIVGIRGRVLGACCQAFDSKIDISHAKAGGLDAEIKIELGEFFELLGKQALIPHRDLSKPVIGELKCARLRRA
jgi:hypothetical protein